MTVSPRTNRLREQLEAGDVPLGVLDSTYSPSLVELYGELGLDFVWLDFEHGGPSPWDAEAIEELPRAAELAEIELLVRLPVTGPALVRKALDAGRPCRWTRLRDGGRERKSGERLSIAESWEHDRGTPDISNRVAGRVHG